MFEFLKRGYKKKIIAVSLVLVVLFVLRNMQGLEQLKFILYGL